MNDLINIESLITGGETQTVEFKEKLPPSNIVSRLISGFANADGGIILFGIREPNHVEGISPASFESLCRRALENITGDVKLSHYVSKVRDKAVGVIKVQKSNTLVGTSEGYYVRVGSHTQALTGQEISLKATHAANANQAIDSMAQTVAKQTEEIGKLRESFEKANSWQRKALYAVLGAIASGLGKALLAALGIDVG